MRERKDIEADAAKLQPTNERPAVVWQEPMLMLVLEVLLDIREQLKRGL